MKTGYAPFARTKRECSCIWHKKLDFHYLNAALRRRKGGKAALFPGNWPYGQFLHYLKAALRRQKGEVWLL